VKRVSLLLSIVAALLVAGVLATAPAAADQPTAIPVGVTIGGIVVGGMAPELATTTVQQAFATPLELRLGTTRVLVAPDVLGAVPVVDKAIERALVAPPNTAVPLGVNLPGIKVTEFVKGLAQRYDRAPVDAKLFLRGLRPWLSKDRPGRKLEQRRAVRDIVSAVYTGQRESIQLYQFNKRANVTRRNFGPVIVIRRGSNRLFLYNGARFRRLFRVATGQTQYPTPLGRFSVIVKWRNPWWYPPSSPWAQGQQPVPPGPGNPLGTRWMGLSAPGVGIHGTPSGGSIGYSVSHGCIRMHIPEAEWLFNQVTVGTTVFIVSS
jgi:L,D-transpeptidase-like protein/putative peptidoglycan binding protein